MIATYPLPYIIGGHSLVNKIYKYKCTCKCLLRNTFDPHQSVALYFQKQLIRYRCIDGLQHNKFNIFI